MYQYEMMLNLLREKEVPVSLAKNEGVNNPRQQVKELRDKGYCIVNSDKATYKLLCK